LRDSDLTKLLGWPGYRVYQHEINERAKTLKLWIRRKRGNRKLVCSGCGRKLEKAHEVSEREVRDLPCLEFRTTVFVEVYRVCCPDCGIKIEKVPQLPSKAPFSKRFEDAVGQACESAAPRQVAHRFDLPASTVRAIDLRYLERWAAARRKPALAQMGVDEIYLGKKQKFITVVSLRLFCNVRRCICRWRRKRVPFWRQSGPLHCRPFGMSLSLLSRRCCQNGPEPSRARRCWERRSEPLTARTVLR